MASINSVEETHRLVQLIADTNSDDLADILLWLRTGLIHCNKASIEYVLAHLRASFSQKWYINHLGIIQWVARIISDTRTAASPPVQFRRLFDIFALILQEKSRLFTVLELSTSLNILTLVNDRHEHFDDCFMIRVQKAFTETCSMVWPYFNSMTTSEKLNYISVICASFKSFDEAQWWKIIDRARPHIFTYFQSCFYAFIMRSSDIACIIVRHLLERILFIISKSPTYTIFDSVPLARKKSYLMTCSDFKVSECIIQVMMKCTPVDEALARTCLRLHAEDLTSDRWSVELARLRIINKPIILELLMTLAQEGADKEPHFQAKQFNAPIVSTSALTLQRLQKMFNDPLNIFHTISAAVCAQVLPILIDHGLVAVFMMWLGKHGEFRNDISEYRFYEIFTTFAKRLNKEPTAVAFLQRHLRKQDSPFSWDLNRGIVFYLPNVYARERQRSFNPPRLFLLADTDCDF